VYGSGNYEDRLTFQHASRQLNFMKDIHEAITETSKGSSP
jgi:hypothetical protein